MQLERGGWEMSTRKILMSILDSPDKTQEMISMFSTHTENSKWTVRNLTELIGKFPDSFVAVRNKEVIMHDKDLIKLIKRLREVLGDISDITIEHVTDKPVKLLL